MKTKVSNHSSYLVRQLPSPTAFVDLEHHIVMISDRWCTFFDLEREKLSGQKIHCFLEHDKILLQKYIDKCIKKASTHVFTTKINTLNPRQVEFSCSPWYDNKEDFIGVIIEANDITESYKKNERLEKFDALLSGISKISKVGLWEYNLNNYRLSWSKMTKKIHEIDSDYQPDMNEAIDFYKQGYSQNAFSLHINKAIEKDISFSERLQIVTQEGNERWVISAGQPHYKDGKLIRLVGTIQDITEEVEAENKIKDSEKLLHTLINNLPLNVYIKDKDSRKILVNKSECDYLGVTDHNKLIGKTDFDFFENHIAQKSHDEDTRVMRTLTPILAQEKVLTKKDGTSTTFLISKIPLLDISGEANGIMGLSIDITEIKNKENELHDLINVTAVQNKKLINFAHIVSHNLRSHTANFSMLLNFLETEKNRDEKRKIMKMLTSASDNLLVTLEDLNQVVEISTNINVEKKQLILKHQIDRVQENLVAFLQENDAELIYEYIDNDPIKAVPAYLDSILMNLITNAVKYRHPKRKPIIKIGYSKKKDVSVLKVSDNGLGIDLKKNGEKLFGMYKTFHQHKDSRGIGLYITKNQVEAMGGKITAESKVNHGTTFTINFYNNGK